MTKGINKVILLGRLGRNPKNSGKTIGDISVSTDRGKIVASISVATSESWTDKSTGQKQERTEWHHVVFFGKLAEVAVQYLTKGSMVYIEGSIKANKWQDKSGVDCYTTEIVANELQIVDSLKSSNPVEIQEFRDDDLLF